MSTSTTAINLAELPAPDVVEQISYEDRLENLKVRMLELYPTFSASVESDPVYKLLELMAYELNRYSQQKNEDLKAVMLAFSLGSDLDHLGARVDVYRLTIQEEDLDVSPPIAAVMESDDDFRARIQLAPEDFTNAGTSPRYRAVALAAHGDVKDAAAISLTAGNVTVAVLSRQGDGTPTAALLNAVRASVSADDVYQLTDHVTVTSAAITRYQVNADMHIQTGPDASIVMNEARANLDRYVEERHGMGRPVTLGGLYAALHVSGVDRVELLAPTADILISETSAAYCDEILLEEAE